MGSNNSKGVAAEGVAVGWFSTNGYAVSVPLAESLPYDLIVDRDGRLQRVSVKFTSQQKGAAFEVPLRRIHVNTRGIFMKPFDKSTADLLFVLCADGSKYLIPCAGLLVKASICVGPKWAQFKVT